VTPRHKAAFYDAVGRPELLHDERFASLIYTHAQKAELFAELAPTFATRTTAEWCDVLAAAGQRYAPVRDYAQVVADPQAWANGYVATDDDGATVVGTPVRFGESATTTGSVPPELGQHTEEILLELGYSWGDIAGLRDTGAI